MSLSTAYAAMVLFTMTVMVVKVFVLAVSTWHFHQPVSAADLALAWGSEWPVLTTVLVVPFLIDLVQGLVDRRSVWRPIRVLLSAISIAATVLLIGLAYLYVVSGFIFWEWGSFLDQSQIVMLQRAPEPESVRFYVAQLPIPLALLLLVTILAMRSLIHPERRNTLSRHRGFVGLVTLVASVLFIVGRVIHTDVKHPAAFSPVLLALQSEPEFTPSIGLAIVPRVTSDERKPAARQSGPNSEYHGMAEGRDVILVALESTRRSSVPLYGYARDTMPTLTGLAAHGLVFTNAYVMQPRSSKTMDSIIMGTSSPLLEPLTWHPERIAGTPNFFSILGAHGYRVYFGVNAAREADGFGSFVSAAAGAALNRLVDAPILGMERTDGFRSDDPVPDTSLVDDFLHWYKDQQGASVALVWFACAHHPYLATEHVFVEHSDRDRYDNCLFSSDVAIDRLIGGIHRLGRQPLVVFFGDHGEAFEEHLGDSMHGHYLYDESIRVPLLFYDPALFKSRRDIQARFTLTDLPATLLSMLGIDEPLGQSEVVFDKTSTEKLYFSNVYGDFKLGMIAGHEKFVYRPELGVSYLFDLTQDPEEHQNLVSMRSSHEIETMQRDVLQWYVDQGAYDAKRYQAPAALAP
jgi:glucan phosphoethanolaminetransferase (alkaline phosphatase superfamily)